MILDSKIFLRFGAVDYLCDVWANGLSVGSHTGGYGDFEFDVTDVWNQGGDNLISVRVQDEGEAYQTRGKQGYGEIRGIWQTVWLESRPQNYLDAVRFSTLIDGTVSISGTIRASESGISMLRFSFDGDTVKHDLQLTLEEGDNRFETFFQVVNPRLWRPESPNLYEGTVSLETGSDSHRDDIVSTYFGIREIATSKVGERDYKWITLNGKPVFLNGTLDQSFIPDGYFTFPDENYIRDEIWRLNGPTSLAFS